jgi:hypothetical protein
VPEQAHQWSCTHEHFTEVGENHHQHDDVRRQVVKLEIIVLQQREEEGGHQESEPGQRVGGEEGNLTALQVGKRNGSATYPPIVLRRLPTEQLPHPHDVMVQPEARWPLSVLCRPGVIVDTL